MSHDHKRTESPAVSIGMPIYNGEKYLVTALESVLDQTFNNFELIISDNASTDRTEQICTKYALRDSRIRYIRHNQNLGADWNFRHTLKEANGCLFTWLACDDVLNSNYLLRATEYMQNNPTCVLVACDFEIIDQHGSIVRVEELRSIRDSINWNKREMEFFRYPISNVYLCIYGLFKTRLATTIEKTVPTPKWLAASELPWVSRFATFGPIASIPATLRQYRTHNDSAYVRERALAHSKTRLRRALSDYRNMWRLRTDQTATLIKSNINITRKCSMVTQISAHYVYSFFIKVLIRICRPFRAS